MTRNYRARDLFPFGQGQRQSGATSRGRTNPACRCQNRLYRRVVSQRPRIHYTESQKALMWERWQKGESLQQIAQLFDREIRATGRPH
jgi:hypothetical protein